MPQTGNKKRQLPKTLKRDNVVIQSDGINEEQRSVTLSFASEQPVSRWFGAEVLQVDNASVNLARFENGLGVLLFNHGRDQVLGKILRAWVDEPTNKTHAEVQFDEDDESERIWQKVKSGTLKGVSVGYSVDSWEEVASGKTSSSGRVIGPAYVAIRWTPLEISIVSVPADDSVGVGREMGIYEDNEGEEGTMAGENTNKERQQPPVVPPVQSDAEREEAQKMERQRCSEITALCRDFNQDPTAFINEGRSVAEVQKIILDSMRSENPPMSTARTVMGADERDKFTRAASDALLLRGGVFVEKPADGALDLRSLRLRDLMIDCLERGGNTKARYLDDETLIRESLTGAGAFAGILSNAANKSMSQGYAGAETTFAQWVGIGSNTDFKEATHYRLSEADELVQITSSGEFKHDEMKEESAKKSVLTYGRSFSLTRQAIINDDLSALTRIPQKYAESANRGINRLVYKVLAKSSDFSADKGNLAAIGSIPSVASIGDGRAAMRTQKNQRGKEVLNISPSFILVPSTLETVTEQLLVSVTDPASSNSGVRNPFTGRLQPICDAELDQYSKDAWYLAARAGLVDTIEVTYLNGVTTPKLESQVSFDILGMKWRIYIDYGVTKLDYRGFYKNPGK